MAIYGGVFTLSRSRNKECQLGRLMPYHLATPALCALILPPCQSNGQVYVYIDNNQFQPCGGKIITTVRDKIFLLASINNHKSRSVPWLRKARARRRIRRAKRARRKRRNNIRFCYGEVKIPITWLGFFYSRKLSLQIHIFKKKPLA